MAELKNIDLRLLECLDTLIRERSVTLAAERLQMSQGNMSNSLARLRRLLGDPLLVRTAHGMMPTDRALEIRDETRDLIRRMHALMESDSNRDIATAQRVIKVACTDATALIALAPIIEDIRLHAPNLQIEVSQILNFRVAEPLGDGTLDLAIGSYIELSEALQVSRLLSGQMLCVVKADASLADGRVDLEGYCAAPHALLAVGHGFRATTEIVIDQALDDIGRARQVRLTSQFITLIAESVARSDLVATMPDYMLRHFAARLPLVGLALPFAAPSFALSAVWHPRAKGDWVLAWFRKQLRRHLNPSPDAIAVGSSSAPEASL